MPRRERAHYKKEATEERSKLLYYLAQLDSLSARLPQPAEEAAGDTLANPFYASLFGCPMLYSATLCRAFSLPSRPDAGGLPSSRRVRATLQAIDSTLLHTYACFPWLVEHAEPERGTLDMDERIKKSIEPELSLTERFSPATKGKEAAAIPPQPPLAEEEDWGIVVRKPNFWTVKTNFSFQFTQNYVSDNWYKGGESHNAMLASTIIEANYNNQRKITFDNKLEMKLGFQTSRGDEEHKYKTNSDLLRLTNKLGLRAVKHWYYTVMLQSWTQFCRGYKANDKKVYSDFMSPFESLLSIGMDYQMETKNKRFKVSATISPLAMKLKYVDRTDLATSFGLNEGHHSKWEYGSNITANLTWNFLKNVTWSSRIYWFTDYSKTQIEWENTLNLTINKYLSTKLFLYPRFDDSASREEGQSYFQFNELLSLGLNVNF